MQGLPCLSNHCITDVLISIHLNYETHFSEPIQLICKEVSLVEEPPAMSAFSFFSSLRSEAAFEPFAKTPNLDFIQHQCQFLPLPNLQLGTPPSQRKEVDLHPPFQFKHPSVSHCLPALLLKRM